MPSESAAEELATLYQQQAVKDGDALSVYLGEVERYCDYIDALRGDL